MAMDIHRHRRISYEYLIGKLNQNADSNGGVGEVQVDLGSGPELDSGPGQNYILKSNGINLPKYIGNLEKSVRY